MVISVTIERMQPVAGTASVGGERTVPFAGWLDLLRVMAGLAEATKDPVDGVRKADERSTTHEVEGRNLS